MGINQSSLGTCPDRSQSQNPTMVKRATLVDGLGTVYPHPSFVDKLRSIMNDSGYGFDYIPEGAATLDFFFNLPSQGYSIIILRVEGVSIRVGDASPVGFATADQIADSQRVSDQVRNDLGVIQANGHTYFAMTPKAVSKLMCGQFQGTTILVMSCNSLGDPSLAQAFISKGASSFIGWNGSVTIAHDDRVFTALATLLTQGISPSSAVYHASNMYGPDPIWGGTISSYN